MPYFITRIKRISTAIILAVLFTMRWKKGR